MKVLSALALVLLVACGGGPERAAIEPAEPDVTIATFAFAPKTSSIEAGTSLVWRNDDDILHTVTSGIPRKQGVPGVSADRAARPDGSFNADLELGETFEHTFTERGVYLYYCDIHSGMRGKVVVN